MFDDEIRAVVVDELAIARLGIVAMLEPLGIDVIAESHGGRDAAAVASYQLPELVVLGATADLSAVDVARRLLAVRPQPIVVALLAHAGHDDAAALARIGVHGVALRSARIEELADVVVRAVKGEQVIAPALTSGLVGALSPSSPTASAGTESPLTAREREVLAFLAEGRSNREIAAALSVGLATVKTHLVKIYAKLGASNRNEALGRAVSAGLLR